MSPEHRFSKRIKPKISLNFTAATTSRWCSWRKYIYFYFIILWSRIAVSSGNILCILGSLTVVATIWNHFRNIMWGNLAPTFPQVSVAIPVRLIEAPHSPKAMRAHSLQLWIAPEVAIHEGKFTAACFIRSSAGGLFIFLRANTARILFSFLCFLKMREGGWMNVLFFPYF